jgi:2-hydroxy-6-oxonona-2,4-dienedioate hydrolase
MTATLRTPTLRSVPAERSEWAEVDGRRLHARTWTTGDRPRVVLVHGMVVASPYLVPMAERLADRFDVWAPDLPGFGQSEGRDLDPRPGPLARVLRDWMDAVGLERPAVVANSYGCQVATEFAMRWPDRVERLVLTSPTADPTARTRRRLLRRFRQESKTQSRELQRILLAAYATTGVRRTLATVGAVLGDRVEERLPFVEVPTLVVRGTADPLVPAAWAEEVCHRLPDARLVTLDDVPHAMVHDAPDAAADVVIAFLTPSDAGADVAPLDPRRDAGAETP